LPKIIDFLLSQNSTQTKSITFSSIKFIKTETILFYFQNQNLYGLIDTNNTAIADGQRELLTISLEILLTAAQLHNKITAEH